MKLGVVGKGGTGKTTLSSLLSMAYVGRGKSVLAIDTDSNPNLAISLGLDERTANTAPLVPRSLAVGIGDGITPSQLITDYAITTPAGVKLMHAMRVDQAGSGCTCSNHAAVRSLLGTAIEDEVDVAVVDMEAGLEHLSRSGGTLAYADILLMVMEPTRKSVITAARTKELAEELGIVRVAGVGNKAHLPDDRTFYEEACAEYGIPLAGVVPFESGVAVADRKGTRVLLPTGPVTEAIEGIVDFVESREARRAALLAEKERLERRLAELTASS